MVQRFGTSLHGVTPVRNMRIVVTVAVTLRRESKTLSSASALMIAIMISDFSGNSLHR